MEQGVTIWTDQAFFCGMEDGLYVDSDLIQIQELGNKGLYTRHADIFTFQRAFQLAYRSQLGASGMRMCRALMVFQGIILSRFPSTHHSSK